MLKAEPKHHAVRIAKRVSHLTRAAYNLHDRFRCAKSTGPSAAADCRWTAYILQSQHNCENRTPRRDLNRQLRSPGGRVVFVRMLQQAGLNSVDVTGSPWTGTPQLTRRTNCLADAGVFLVGDAAGYVEPFTGEGIAWALAGGVGVADCAAEAIRGCQRAAARRWQRQWRRQVRQRQSWCRRLAWLLKFSSAAPTIVQLAARFPAIFNPIVRHLNSGMDPVQDHNPSLRTDAILKQL